MGLVYRTNAFTIFSHVPDRQVRQSLLLWVIMASWLSYCASTKVDCDKIRGFWCSRTDTCIPASAQCDNQNDCTHGEDEVNCAGYCVEVGKFWCNESKRCIFPSSRCDSYRDCEHGEDEANCPNYCRQNSQFWCQELTKCVGGLFDEDGLRCPSYCADQGNFWCNKSSQCIRTVSLCDENKDCAYGEDEEDCSGVLKISTSKPFYLEGSCSNADEVWCSSSRMCFNVSSRCDGIEHCLGGEDEIDCLRYCYTAANFWCNISKKCVSASSRCDGPLHCSFGEDEANCTSKILAGFLPAVILIAVSIAFIIYKWCCAQKFGIQDQLSAPEGHKATMNVETGALRTTLTTPTVAAVLLTPPLYCESVHNDASTTSEKAEPPAYDSVNYVPSLTY